MFAVRLFLAPAVFLSALALLQAWIKKDGD